MHGFFEGGFFCLQLVNDIFECIQNQDQLEQEVIFAVLKRLVLRLQVLREANDVALEINQLVLKPLLGPRIYPVTH